LRGNYCHMQPPPPAHLKPNNPGLATIKSFMCTTKHCLVGHCLTRKHGSPATAHFHHNYTLMFETQHCLAGHCPIKVHGTLTPAHQHAHHRDPESLICCECCYQRHGPKPQHPKEHCSSGHCHQKKARQHQEKYGGVGNCATMCPPPPMDTFHPEFTRSSHPRPPPRSSCPELPLLHKQTTHFYTLLQHPSHPPLLPALPPA
jgi:hypothetical protein